MRAKSKVLRRISMLYIVFFISIAIAVVSTFNGEAFKAGFQQGYNEANPVLTPGGYNTMLVGIENSANMFEYPMQLDIKPGNQAKATARVSTFDVMIAGQGDSPFVSGWGVAFMLVSAMSYGAVFIMIFIILSSLRRSIKQDNIFEHRNIIRTRAIGLLLIVASLASSAVYWIDNRIAASTLDLASSPGLSIKASFPFSFMELITAIMVLFIAEIFAIGYAMSQEQKLTI